MTKAGLSAPRRRLLVSMQQLNFGRIEDLEIRDGDPVFSPRPAWCRTSSWAARTVRGRNSATRILCSRTKSRSSSITSRGYGDGTVESIEVKHGLPFRLVIEMAG